MLKNPGELKNSAMSLSKVLTIVIFVSTLFAGRSYAGEGVRQGLIGSGGVEALYSIDERTTLVSFNSDWKEELKSLCASHDGEFELYVTPEGEGARCKGVFETISSGNSSEGGVSYLIRHSNEEVVYKSETLPSYADVSYPDNGDLKEDYSTVELYQYVYALCKKNSGKPAFVMPKRYGKFVRLTQVSAVEAFKHIYTSANDREPWFLSCEGRKKFIVEKEYKYNSEDGNRYRFYSNRGLEGIDYVKSDEDAGYLAALSASGRTAKAESPEFLEEMAWELASLKVGFIKTDNGIRYTGSYRNEYKKEGCSVVSIKTANMPAVEEKVYSYRVCKDRVAKIEGEGYSPVYAMFLGNSN